MPVQGPVHPVKNGLEAGGQCLHPPASPTLVPALPRYHRGMSKLLLNLRNVPDDEADDVRAMLDAKVEELCAKILLTFPDCTTKTLEELRKPKLEAWNRNKEDSRSWLALNMMTEARSGFTAFNEGPKDDREVDFVLLRQKLIGIKNFGKK